MEIRKIDDRIAFKSFVRASSPVSIGDGIGEDGQVLTNPNLIVGVAAENAKVGDYFYYYPIGMWAKIKVAELVDLTSNGELQYEPGTGWINATSYVGLKVTSPVDKTPPATTINIGEEVWGIVTSYAIGAAGGETNVGANVGTAGSGVYNGKSGVTLNFRKLNALTSSLTIAEDGVNQKIDFSVVPGQIDHDSLLNFVANEHVDHSSVSVGTIAGSGLTGGGNLTTTRNLSVDINGQTGESSLEDVDEFLFYDSSAVALRKITRLDLQNNLSPTITRSFYKVTTGTSVGNSDLTLSTGGLTNGGVISAGVEGDVTPVSIVDQAGFNNNSVRIYLNGVLQLKSNSTTITGFDVAFVSNGVIKIANQLLIGDVIEIHAV